LDTLTLIGCILVAVFLIARVGYEVGRRRNEREVIQHENLWENYDALYEDFNFQSDLVDLAKKAIMENDAESCKEFLEKIKEPDK
jgi:hypothetical protein